MIETDAEAALFSLKSFAAAMVAYYLCLRIGFSRPVWSLMTVYFLSQPLAGQVVSKGFFRMLGTALGAAAAVVFLPAFVNEPPVLCFVLAVWLGLCVYLALLDRTPRSYVFLLSGYTVSIIGFPSVATPGSIFDTAVLRVQEIAIGIATTTLVHGAIFPRTVTKRLMQQVVATVCSIEQVSRRALAGSRDAGLDGERRRLASSVNSIQQLAYHLTFDTAGLLPPSEGIRAVQHQVCWLLPLSSAVEDRIAECSSQEGGLPTEVAALIGRVNRWCAEDISGPRRDPTARELVAAAQGIEQSISVQVSWRWRDTLLVSLLERLAELVLSLRVLRELQDHILSGSVRGLSLEAARLVESASGRSLHRDHALAMRSALGTVVAVCAVCTFWIATAWPQGATAALIVSLFCAIAPSLPHPGGASHHAYAGILFSIPIAAAFGFVLFPRVTDLVMLAAVTAPLLLLLGSLLARPTLYMYSLGTVIGFLFLVGFTTTYQSDFQNFINAAIAAAAGTGAAVLFIGIFQEIGAELALQRLLRAGFRDIAMRADGRDRDTGRWVSRMFDRIALIGVRSGPSGVHPPPPPYDALVGVRVGYLAGELCAFRSTLCEGEERNAIDEALKGISAYYLSTEPARREPVGDAVLHAIDRAMTAFAVDPRPERRLRGAVLLTGLRRSLFPSARAFTGAPE